MAEFDTDLDGVSAPFAEQLAFFRRKGKNLIPSNRWDDVWQEAHDTGFMVAGAQKAALLADLHQEMQNAIEKGTTLEEFTKALPEIAKKHGWTGWRGEGSEKGVAWRARVIYETNLRTSYSAGRYRQLVTGAQRRPYWQYRHSPHVAVPRPLHRSWDGKVLRWDDPWWNTHFPPNGFGCRCSVFGLNDRDLKRAGKSGPDPAPNDGDLVRHERERVNYETGEVTQEVVYAPPGVDPGFAYAPGKADLAREAAARAEQQSAALPEPLQGAVRKDVALIRSHPTRPGWTPAEGVSGDQAAIAEATQRTRAAGVKVVDFGDSPAMAENVSGALEELAAKGARMPDVVVADEEMIRSMATRQGLASGDIPAAFVQDMDLRANLLYLNPSSPAWADVSAWLGTYFSTRDEQHIVRHEIGHLTHAVKKPDQYSASMQVHDDQGLLIASSVSGYAAENGQEFVAEVYAALVSGRQLGADVMGMYRKLGGIVP